MSNYTFDGQKTKIFYTYSISQHDLAAALTSGKTTATVTYEVDTADNSGFQPHFQTFTINLASQRDTSISSIVIGDGDAATAALIDNTGMSILTTGDKTLSFMPKPGLTYTVGVHADSGDLGFLTATADNIGHITWNYSVNTANLNGYAPGQSHDDTFTLTLFDSAGLATTQEIHVTVAEPTAPPQVTSAIAIHGTAVAAGSDAVTLDALLNASDPQGSALTIDLSATALPAGITFDAQTHLFAFDPAQYYQSAMSGSATVSYTIINGFGQSTPQTATFYVDSGGATAAVSKTAFNIDIADNGLSTNGNYAVHGVLAFDQPDLDIVSGAIAGRQMNAPGTFAVNSVLATADPHRTLVTYTYVISQSELSFALGNLANGATEVISPLGVDFPWDFGTLTQNIFVHLSSSPGKDFVSAIVADGGAGDTTFTHVSGDETKTILTSGPQSLSFATRSGGAAPPYAAQAPAITYHIAVEAAAGDIGSVSASNDQSGHITWTYQVNEAAVLALGPGATKTDNFELVLYDSNGHATTQQVSATVAQPETGPVAADFSAEHFYWRHSYTGPSDTTFTNTFTYFRVPGYATSFVGSVASASGALSVLHTTSQSVEGQYLKVQVEGGVRDTTFGQAVGTFQNDALTIRETDAQGHASSHQQIFVNVNPVFLSEVQSDINTQGQVAAAADAVNFAHAAVLLAASGSILFLDGPGSFNLSAPVLLSGFDQLVVSPGVFVPGGAHVGLRSGVNMEVTSLNTGTKFFLADALYKFHGDGHGDEFFIENSAALHAGAVFDESVAGSGTAIHFTEGAAGGAYDLSLASIHNVDHLALDAANDIVSVTSASIASFTQITGAAGSKLTTAEANLELSHAAITGVDVQSSAVLGTEFKVASGADASHIVFNSSGALDSLTVTGVELSQAAVNDLFGRGSVAASDTFQFIRTGSSIYAGNNGAAISGDADVTNLHGSDGADTFVFKANFGTEKVSGFTAGADTLKFDAPAESVDTLLANATQDTGGTTLHLSGGSSVLIAGVTLETLHQHPADFIL